MLTFVWIIMKITLFSYPAFLYPFFSVALYILVKKLLLVILYVVTVVIHVKSYTRLIYSRLLHFYFVLFCLHGWEKEYSHWVVVAQVLWIEDSDMSLWFLFKMHINYEDSVKRLLTNSFRNGSDVLSSLEWRWEDKVSPKALILGGSDLDSWR